MPAVARDGDIGHGVCNGPGHPSGKAVTVTLVGNTDTADENGTKLCTVGCMGNADCGHTSSAQTGSSIVTVNGQALHRVGDTGELPGGGTYTVSTGSSIIDCA